MFSRNSEDFGGKNYGGMPKISNILLLHWLAEIAMQQAYHPPMYGTPLMVISVTCVVISTTCCMRRAASPVPISRIQIAAILSAVEHGTVSVLKHAGVSGPDHRWTVVLSVSRFDTQPGGKKDSLSNLCECRPCIGFQAQMVSSSKKKSALAGSTRWHEMDIPQRSWQGNSF